MSDLFKQLEDKKKEKDCLSSNKAYEEFSKWWETARNIRDEDGDKILEWDKSNIANFCFSSGLRLGLERKHKSNIDILEQAIAEKKEIEIQMEVSINTIDKLNKELEQATTEMQKQRQEILEKIDKFLTSEFIFDNNWEKKYREVIRVLINLKEQLNQPKTEE